MRKSECLVQEDKFKHGDLIPIEQFKEAVRDGGFTDYDGFGQEVVATLHDEVTPSQVDNIREEATHVLWFNK